MKRIYVAGAYSANTTRGSLQNVGRGIRQALEVQRAGHSPFVPWEDCLRYIAAAAAGLPIFGEPIESVYERSMQWLEVSHAVLLTPGHEKSRGTKAEIDNALALGIPVFSSLHDLKQAVET